MSVTIQNTNELYGDSVEFTGETLEEAVAEMQAAVRACGPELESVVVTNDDYIEVPTVMSLTEALKTIDPDQLLQHMYGGGYWDADALLETSDEDDRKYIIDDEGIVLMNGEFRDRLVWQFVKG